MPSPFPSLEAAALRHSEKRLMLPASRISRSGSRSTPGSFHFTSTPENLWDFPFPALLLTQPWGQTG